MPDGAPPRPSAQRGALSELLAELVAGPAREPPYPWDHVVHPGARVGRFELLRELGRGGFGIVFEARDGELDRRVAFKAIRPGARERHPAAEELLRREAIAVAQLQHPHIVTLHDVGRADAGPFLVLELLRGETLAQRLRRGRLSARAALLVALAVARALVHAHARGVLHRDLKPSNVFVEAGGGVKVLDFGLAHVFGAAGPAGSGTPGYMAPEQRLGGSEDARTDVYSAGIVLAEMLSAVRPSDADGVEPLLAAARVPRPVAALVRACTRPDPAARPSSAPELADAIARLLGALDRSPRRAPAGVDPAAVDALRHFFRGEECQARPVLGQDCADHYRRAIAIDPTLAVAHYQLAVWSRRFGAPVAEQRAAIARAVRHRRRAPRLEQLLIEAFAAHLAGRDDEAISLFREATERFPDDKRAFYEMGDLLRHRDELELAVPCFERTVALDPHHGWAAGQLAEALGALDRTLELRAWVARWEAAPSPMTLHALSVARGWLGDAAGAMAAARRAVGLGAGLVAQQDLLAALVFDGRYREAEGPARTFAGEGSPVRRIGFYALAALEAYRGRRRAGLARLDELRRAIPEVARDGHYHAVRADHLLGDRDPAAVRAEVEALEAIDPRMAAEHAPGLAWLGDLDAAAALARRLPPDSTLARTHGALAAWHRGERDRALDLLRALCAKAPVSAWRVAPIWFLADLAGRAGLEAEAADAHARCAAMYLPRTMWRSWAHPRGLVELARLRARLGDAAAARAALGRFLTEWADADGADPLLARARALEDELAAR